MEQIYTPELTEPSSGNVFARKFSSITGNRWDPLFYQRDLFDFVRGRNNLVSLGSMLISIKTGFGAGKRDQGDKSDGIIQIRPTNMSPDYKLIFDRNVYIAPEHATTNSQDILENGEVLFNNTNSQSLVGKTVLFKREGIYFASNHITRLKADPSQLRSDFLGCLLSLYQEKGVFYRLCTNWNNQSGVGPQVLRRLLVPDLALVHQEKIADKWNESLNRLERAKSEAKALLASIDDLLLAELGVPNPPEPPNTLESRMFQRNFSEVSGKRIDPASNWKRLDFSASKFPVRPLREVVKINPVTVFPNIAPDTQISFVPMESVSDVFGEITHLQTRAIGDSRSYTTFQEGDVIWAKITPCMENGKSAVAQNLEGGYGFGSTEFHVFRANSKVIHPDFLHHLLRLNTVRKSARLNFTGSSGHQRVDEDFFTRMEIPLPPTGTQRTMADRAESAKLEAKTLFAQAQADLEHAKCEIEAMILGEPTSVPSTHTQ